MVQALHVPIRCRSAPFAESNPSLHSFLPPRPDTVNTPLPLLRTPSRPLCIASTNLFVQAGRKHRSLTSQRLCFHAAPTGLVAHVRLQVRPFCDFRPRWLLDSPAFCLSVSVLISWIPHHGCRDSRFASFFNLLAAKRPVHG